jgi:hypothetical protein
MMSPQETAYGGQAAKLDRYDATNDTVTTSANTCLTKTEPSNCPNCCGTCRAHKRQQDGPSQ